MYFIARDDHKYAGNYSYNRETDLVSGCPAKAPIVHTVMKAIKTRAVSKGAAATRQHAEAITIEDLTQMIQWSEQKCPHSLFQRRPNDAQMAKDMNLHGLMRAFSTTGFNLFTRSEILLYFGWFWAETIIRNFETASIQYGDITFNCKGPAPYYLPYFTISLEERKGWQKQAGYDGPRTSMWPLTFGIQKTNFGA